ncbi:bifunctional transcriptional activator/DNA repair enzyme AdaA [Skermanella pratensis]|uniref:bifunctional transcriptional activator/DNA repair enzyme AdaA n=1 Tax=Skermanella pratensis TaxID=2233999 RepID=UPI0013018CC4|nr:methylated-DNA--[protein]-cysteine S-methyltransferase [Skermanella pratensis]
MSILEADAAVPDRSQADLRWTKLLARDRSADGAFVYAVRTTGVFCRPSCPARPPRRENVQFFASAAEAETAGYRACLRCRPLAAEGKDPLALKVGEIAAFIRDHADEPLPLARLAGQAGLSPFHLQRSFTAVLGVSPRAFQAAERMKILKARLREGDDVTGAIFSAGYGSTSRVYEQVDGGLGMTPSAYRAGGAGETIVHAVRETALGPLMMAATDRGVCFVQFGESGDGLERRLRSEFPGAALVPAAEANGQLDDWMTALDGHLSRGGPRPDLPLDLRGTAFQIRVWRFLLGTGAGGAVSYAEVAVGAGAPRAVRAAASACASNRIAVLVPCHRALRADGGLGGYRWGADRKRTLLAAERAARAESLPTPPAG